MYVIRKKQVGVFDEVSMRAFEANMIRHMKEFFPEHYNRMSEEDRSLFIRYGIETARDFEIVSEQDVCMYIDLMIVLGGNFYRDPNLPWAAQILSTEDITHPTERINVLHDRAVKHLDEMS